VALSACGTEENRTSRRRDLLRSSNNETRLAQIDFEADEFPDLEQNPHTKSHWAKMAREGTKVMQFLRAGRYVGVVADEVLKHYSSTEKA
jgi:hypothetical protein